MRSPFPFHVAAPLLALLAACGAVPTTGIANAQQIAQQFNLDARLGRNEYVLDQIAPTERQEYAERHRAWGSAIRVADVEMGTVHPRSDKDVDILVHVAWYRPEQLELKSTTIKQLWHTTGIDTWQLLSEARVDGDYGLLGEAVIFAPSTEPHAPARFPIIRLDGQATD